MGAGTGERHGRGNLRAAKTPPLQPGIAGISLRPKCRPCRHHEHTIQELCKTLGNFFITMRHATALRSSIN